MNDAKEQCDVLIIGAGPAGLTAACYLARYRRRVLVVHDNRSRALRIPLTHNAPGFPGGVSGVELIERMSAQAELYGALIVQDHVRSIVEKEDGFEAQGKTTFLTRAVILATGIELNQVDLPHDVHEKAIGAGTLRYCPVCDGYEATDKVVGVLGSDAHGAREALFLRQWSSQVTLLPKHSSNLSAEQVAELVKAGVRVMDEPVARLEPTQKDMQVVTEAGVRLAFDVLYPALGSRPRARLAAQLGVNLTEDGCLPANAHEGLPVAGTFAAGDVVDGLDQISVAVGHGAVAATRAHNFLREQDGLVLRSE